MTYNRLHVKKRANFSGKQAKKFKSFTAVIDANKQYFALNRIIVSYNSAVKFLLHDRHINRKVCGSYIVKIARSFED